jgi:heterodisulfide reductase subunit C
MFCFAILLRPCVRMVPWVCVESCCHLCNSLLPRRNRTGSALQVFRDAGVQNGTVASAAVGLINVLGTVIAATLMDRAGRKCASTLAHIPRTVAALPWRVGANM